MCHCESDVVSPGFLLLSQDEDGTGSDGEIGKGNGVTRCRPDASVVAVQWYTLTTSQW